MVVGVLQTCHLVRIVRIQYGFLPFLRWYGRIKLWYGFEAKYWKTIYEYVKRNKTVLSSTQLAFSAKFPTKKREISLRWSTIDLINQRRRPNPTVAPREVKLRFWFFAAGCRFLLHHVAIFWQTASRYESRERFRDKSMHKWRIRTDTDFHWTNTDFPHEIVACLVLPHRVRQNAYFGCFLDCMPLHN